MSAIIVLYIDFYQFSIRMLSKYIHWILAICLQCFQYFCIFLHSLRFHYSLYFLKTINDIILYSISSNSNIYSLYRSDSRVYCFYWLSIMVLIHLSIWSLFTVCFLKLIYMVIFRSMGLKSNSVNSVSFVSVRHLGVQLPESTLNYIFTLQLFRPNLVDCGIMLVNS